MTPKFTGVLGAAGVLLAGCGSPNPVLPKSSGPVVEITIASGAVTPANAVVQAKVGQPITLRVNSDVDDQLHVHATPDRTFDVAPEPEQTFEFTADVPGRVEVELHHINRTVATIHVRP